MDLTGLHNRWCASTAVHHVRYIYVKEGGTWRTLSLSLRLVTWPLVGVCLTFSMAVGEERSTGPLAPLTPTPDTETPTITHASECKLPEAVNHFEKIPDSPRAPSLRVCLRYPFPSHSFSSSLTPFFYVPFFFRPRRELSSFNRPISSSSSLRPLT